jgi:hypothetical protein
VVLVVLVYSLVDDVSLSLWTELNIYVCCVVWVCAEMTAVEAAQILSWGWDEHQIIRRTKTQRTGNEFSDRALKPFNDQSNSQFQTRHITME